MLLNDPTPRPSALENLERRIMSKDYSRDLDLLLIIGTSLSVYGMKTLVKDFAKKIHLNNGTVILVNKEEVKGFRKDVVDYWVQGDCDKWVEDLNS